LIELSNVTLGVSDEAPPNPDDPFPPTVGITSTSITFARWSPRARTACQR
jgi:hypothetical protein